MQSVDCHYRSTDGPKLKSYIIYGLKRRQ